MKQDYFGGVAGMVKKLALLAPVAITADGNSGGVDITKFSGNCLLDLAVFNTAGTLPTLDIKLQTSAEVVPINAQTYSGTGNGTITEIEAGPDAVHETITVHLASATTFEVTGSVTGSMAAGIVGTKYESPQCSFLVTAGGTAFIHTDEFTFHITKARAYTDVADGSFTQVVAENVLTYKSINVDELGKYLRFNFDIGGTVGPSYTVGANIFGFTQ